MIKILTFCHFENILWQALRSIQFFCNDEWSIWYWMIELYYVPVGFVTPPPILRLNIAYFAVAEGWLLLDIGWFDLFLNEIWLSPKTKAPTPTENPNSNLTTQKRHQNVDYKTIADRLRTVSWGNDTHPPGVVKLVYRILTLLTAKA